MANKHITRTPQTNDKKRKIVVGFATTAIILGSIAAGVAVFLTKNKNKPLPPINQRKDININQEFLNNFNSKEIQKIIDKNEYTIEEFLVQDSENTEKPNILKDCGLKKYVDSTFSTLLENSENNLEQDVKVETELQDIVHEIPNSDGTPSERNITLKVLSLKLGSFASHYKFKFDENAIPPYEEGKNRFFLDDNDSTLHIILNKLESGENNDEIEEKIDWCFFKLYNISNFNEAYESLQKEIFSKEKRYTFEEFKNDVETSEMNKNIMVKFYEKLKFNDEYFGDIEEELPENEKIYDGVKMEGNNPELLLSRKYKKYKYDIDGELEFIISAGDVENNENEQGNKTQAFIQVGQLNFYSLITANMKYQVKNDIQRYIEDGSRRWIDQELEYGLKNDNELKNIIAESIELSNNTPVDLNLLNEPELTKNQNSGYDITISLKSLDENKQKYNVNTSSSNDDIEINKITINGEVIPQFTIKGLKVFTEHKITNQESAYNALVEDIQKKEHRYSEEEFQQNQKTLSDIFYKELLVDGKKFNKSEFAGQQIDYQMGSKKLELQLDKNYKKYRFENWENITFNYETSIISIDQLQFFTNTKIDIKTSLKTITQLYIKENGKQTKQEFDNSEKLVKNLAPLLAKEMTNITSTQLTNFVVNNDSLIFYINQVDDNNLSKYTFVGETNDIKIDEIDKEDGGWFYKVTISDLKFFEEFSINDAQNASSALENEIKKISNRYTKDDFKKVFENEEKKVEIMNIIYKNLKLNDDLEFNIDNYVVDSNFDEVNNKIEIQLNTDYKKYKLPDDVDQTKFEYDENSSKLIFKDTKFFSINSMSIDTTNLLNDFQNNYVKVKKCTIDEFKQQLKIEENQNSLKNIISNQITGLEINKIFEISMNNAGDLIIKLVNNEYEKYSIDSSLIDGFEFTPIHENNTTNAFLTIKNKNLKFFRSYNIGNVNLAYDALTAKIDEWNNRYTIEQFREKVNYEACLEKFVNELSNFDKNLITSEIFDDSNNTIKLKLVEDEYTKYSMSNYEDKVIFTNNESEGSIITINTKNFFWTEKLITIQPGIKTDIHNFIREYNNRFTQSEIVGSSQTKPRVLNWIRGIDETYITSIQSTSDSLILNIKNTNKPIKYVFDNKEESNVSISYNSNSCSITIKNLQYYTISTFISEEILKDTWNKVDNYIWNNSVRVSSQWAHNKYRDNHKAAIADIIGNTQTYANKPLRNFINNLDTDIWRWDNSIAVRLKNTPEFDSVIQNDWIKMGINTYTDDNNIFLEIKDYKKELQLRWLSFTNPENFFNWKDYYNISNICINGYRDEAKAEGNTILFPKKTITLSNPTIADSSRFTRFLMADILKKEVNTANPWDWIGFFADRNQQLEFVKFPRRTNNNGVKIQEAIQKTMFRGAKILDIKFFEGYLGPMIQSWGFQNSTFPNNYHIQLPSGVISIMDSGMAGLKGATELTTWSHRFHLASLNWTNFTKINLMSTSTNTSDFWVDTRDWGQDMNPNIVFNFKSQQLYDYFCSMLPSWKNKFKLV